MPPKLTRTLSRNLLFLLVRLLTVGAATYFFLLPGISMVRELRDPAIGGPQIPQRAWRLHRDVTPRIERWARERIASQDAAGVALHDVPTTEWPIFGSVFYLMATAELQASWERGESPGGRAPLQYAQGAISAAKDLILDPSHHTWVRTHWGDGYLHRENVFFRSLLIAGLTSYERLTHDGTVRPMLRDQVETLVRDLDRSKRGVLNDYPEECYPIDVLAGIGFIQQADAVLGTSHQSFIARAVRAFKGPMADSLGLVPYRMNVETGEQEQPSRGIGNSWVSLFAPDLWPEHARSWYSLYERWFWQDHRWAAGFREFARPTANAEWMFEVDAGPVLDGFGTAASAFGIAAARRNGRLDHAYTLSAQLLAVAWPLPDGTLLGPRVLSHATAAPYLGESAILYFLTVQPAPGVPIITGGTTPWLVWFILALCFGLSLGVYLWAGFGIRRLIGMSGDFGPRRLQNV